MTNLDTSSRLRCANMWHHAATRGKTGVIYTALVTVAGLQDDRLMMDYAEKLGHMTTLELLHHSIIEQPYDIGIPWDQQAEIFDELIIEAERLVFQMTSRWN